MEPEPGRTCFPFYLVRTCDIDLVFKLMTCRLLANRLQLNKEAGRWGVRKRRSEWKAQDAGQGRGRQGGTKEMGFVYHCCAQNHTACTMGLQGPPKALWSLFLTEGGCIFLLQPPYHIVPEGAGCTRVRLAAEVETVRRKERIVRQSFLVTGQKKRSSYRHAGSCK